MTAFEDSSVNLRLIPPRIHCELIGVKVFWCLYLSQSFLFGTKSLASVIFMSRVQ
jgi:hypothetical protein